MKKLLLVMTVVTASLVSCIVLRPDIPDMSPDTCYELGVQPDFNTGPMSPVLSERRTTLGGVAKHCEVSDNFYWLVTGCVKPEGDGYAIIYSDAQSRQHEYCHSIYGFRHARAPWMGREWEAKRRCQAANKEHHFDGLRWRCREG